MPRYNHQLWLAFSVESNRRDGEDLTPAQIRAAIARRLHDLVDDEVKEATLPPGDTYAIEEESSEA